MKGVILAAGMASRLRPLTDGTPKCLLDVGGRTILALTLENLTAAGFRDIVMVTGYREEQIRRYVGENSPSLSVEFVTNKSFAETNNSYSLWLTRRAVGEDGIMLLDSDILFDRRILGLLSGSPEANCLAMVRGKPLGDEEIKMKLGPGGRLLRIGKDVPPQEAAGESIGIEKLSASCMGCLFDILERTIVGRKTVDLFYEAAFQEAIDAGVAMTAVDVKGLPCIEIDTPDDLEAARAMRAPAGQHLFP
ncbi:MAG TPA: phosphocholine cytidylyltransferase family protein [Bacteroidota bacterium]|nr:phosphocholine cytidylyltransferase family protein [Bacteroidota bacterium]